MKPGDLVLVDCLSGEYCGIVMSKPRISDDCAHASFGTMDGDIYQVLDVLMPWGLELFTDDEIVEVLSEAR